MKFFTAIPFIVLFFVSCSSKQNATEPKPENRSTSEQVFENFLRSDEGKMFRAIDFNMTISEVRKIEREQSNTSEMHSEKMNEVKFQLDLSDQFLDFAELVYFFDAGGLSFISANGYFKSKKNADAFYKHLEKYFTTKYGNGEWADDGFLEITTEYNKNPLLIAIKPIDFTASSAENENSYGFFLFFSLLN